MPMYYVCTGCENVLPYGMFYTYKGSNGNRVRRKRCKTCTIEKTLEAHAKRLKKEGQ